MWIKISREAHAAIRSMAERPLNEKATRHLSDGVEIEVEEETLERMDGVRFPGESNSDLIIRLAASYHSGGKPQ